MRKKKHSQDKHWKRMLDRERKRNKRWWRRFLSIEANVSELAEISDTVSWDSDKGAGVESLVRLIDGDEENMAVTKRRLHAAYMKVMRNLPRCLDVFNAIIRNGNNREKSICELQRIMQTKSDARRVSRQSGGAYRGDARVTSTSATVRG